MNAREEILYHLGFGLFGGDSNAMAAAERLLNRALNEHAHELEEKIRGLDYDPGEVGPLHLSYLASADMIDPEA